MKKLERLKIEARNSANNHGHRMSAFHTTKWRKLPERRAKPRGAIRPEVAQSALATCKDCGAYVQVNTHPVPNEIEIGGDVYGKQCIQRND